jgi:predicted 2-oxoglutarate/Fe(II)-dependent dioxygenase YbiX
MTRELVLGAYGVRIGVVDAAGAGICARLLDALPPTVRVEHDPGTPGVRYVVRPAAAIDLAPPACDVLCDDDVRLRGRAADEVVEWLRIEIDRAVAVGSREVLFVHAGVVGWRGRAILVPGRSMTGKSTLVAALVRRGATYYSDEYAVLTEDGRVYPYARVPVFRDTPGTGPDAVGEAVGHEPLPVSLIVSTAYSAGATWAPEIVRGTRAVLSVIDNTVLARIEPERMLRIAGQLSRTAVTLQGARPDAESVTPAILDFADGLLDGRLVPPGDGPASARERTQMAARAVQVFERTIPARYLRLDDVLEPADHARLLEYALAHEPGFESSSVVGSAAEERVDRQHRASGTIASLDALVGGLERRLRGLVPHARRELGLPWFPVSKTEIQMVVHQLGDFFSPHTDDGSEAVAGRRLTCVYYFHRLPRRFSGGELRLYDSLKRGGRLQRADTYLSVEPADNSAVFFPSGCFHEVRPVRSETRSHRDSRFSVNVWFWAGSDPRWDVAQNPS